MERLKELANIINALNNKSDSSREYWQLNDQFSQLLDECYRNPLEQARDESEIRYWKVRQELHRLALIESGPRFFVPDEPLDYRRIEPGESESSVACVVSDWHSKTPYQSPCRTMSQHGLVVLLMSDGMQYESDHPKFYEYWEKRPFPALQ